MDEIQQGGMEVVPIADERKVDMARESIIVDGYAGLKKGLFAFIVVLLILSAIGAFAIFGYISKDYYRYREADLSLEDCERKIDEANMEAYSLLQTNQMVRAASREALSVEMKNIKEKIDKGLKAYEVKIAEQKKEREAEFEKTKDLYASMTREFSLSYESRTNELEQTFAVRKRHLNEQIKFLTADCERLRTEWLQCVANTGRIAVLKEEIKDLQSQRESLQEQDNRIQGDIAERSRALIAVSTNLVEQSRLCSMVTDSKCDAEIELNQLRQRIESLRAKEQSARQSADDASIRKGNADKDLVAAKKAEDEALKHRQMAAAVEAEIDRYNRDRERRAATLGRLDEEIESGSNRLAQIEFQLKSKKQDEDMIRERKRILASLDQLLSAEKGKLSALREEVARLTVRTNDLSDAKVETEVK